jgi:hypothetical protein
MSNFNKDEKIVVHEYDANNAESNNKMSKFKRDSPAKKVIRTVSSNENTSRHSMPLRQKNQITSIDNHH